MKNSILFFCATLFLFSCSSKNQQDELPAECDDNQMCNENVCPQQKSFDNKTEYNSSKPSTSSYEGYDNGYKSGYDMGYIAGRENYEYNPYLTVGPNTRTFSLDYRKGYSAGYSVGYANGQQTSHQGIYEDYDYDDNSYDYEGVDYDYD